MKRFLCLLLLLASVSLPAQAQWIRGYGLKAGLTSSDVRSPDLDDIYMGDDPFNENRRRRIGVAALGFVEWLNARPFSIITEAGYTQRGFYFEHEKRDAQNRPIGTFKTFDRFDYLLTAALAKLRYPEGRVTPYVVAGPHLGIFLGGEPDEQGTLAGSYALVAFGGTVGLGTEVNQVLPVSLFLELRYSFDVTNSLPDVPRDAYNNALDVLLGMRL